MSSLFDAVEMAPRDPILGLNEQFNADANPNTDAALNSDADRNSNT